MENWVERRANEDRLFFTQGPLLWDDLKDALSFSVKEYHKHYVAPGQAEIHIEPCAGGDTNCVRMRRVGPASQVRVLEIRFDIHKLIVAWKDPSGMPVPDKGKELRFGISESGQVRLFNDASPVDVAQASKIILEAFLFPALSENSTGLTRALA